MASRSPEDETKEFMQDLLLLKLRSSQFPECEQVAPYCEVTVGRDQFHFGTILEIRMTRSLNILERQKIEPILSVESEIQIEAKPLNVIRIPNIKSQYVIPERQIASAANLKALLRSAVNEVVRDFIKSLESHVRAATWRRICLPEGEVTLKELIDAVEGK